MAVVYLGLGSNIGDRTRYLAQACATLQQHAAITFKAVSALYKTDPLGVTEQDWFLNAVACLDTTLSPAALLNVIQATEQRLGRVPTFRWGPRCIDIDILLYDELEVCTPDLIIPHALLHERAFVLVPLYELAPDLLLPSGKSVRNILATVSTNGTQRLHPFPSFMDNMPYGSTSASGTSTTSDR
ncbi:MAG: 2-amino-4-hydroxy-6-hydroxymethyldihydropteridine diphosphokinase [bacterium]|nr:2-amino-4-hydroxy-6-hydroxymethyldihydropteridine diphosphokinase [bacterium]